MPAIPTFGVEQGRQAAAAVTLRPSEVGTEALNQAARNISRLTMEQAASTRTGFNEVDAGLKAVGTDLTAMGVRQQQHTSLEEAQSAGPVAANILFDQSAKMKAAVASNDPTAVQQFRDQLDDQLDQFENTATTPAAREHAIGVANTLRNHFTTGLMAEQTAMAGHQAITSLGQTTNTLAAGAAAHPETLDASLSLLDQQGSALKTHSNVTPQGAAALDGVISKQKSALASSTISSVIIGNPDAADPIASNPAAGRSMIQRYSRYLTPEQQTELAHRADVQDKLNLEQNNLQDKQQTKQQDDAFKTKVTDLTASVIQSDGSIHFDNGAMSELGQAMLMPGASRSTLGQTTLKLFRTLAQDQQTGKDVTTNPATMTSLTQAAMLPPGEPGALTTQQLYQAKIDGNLSNRDFSTLNELHNKMAQAPLVKQVEGKMVGQFLSGMSGYFGNNTGMLQTPTNDTMGAYTRFMTWFQPALASAEAKGTPASEFISQLQAKGPQFFDTFKTPPQANAGSGLAVPAAPVPNARAAAPIPPAEGGQPTSAVGALWHSLFGGGK